MITQKQRYSGIGVLLIIFVVAPMIPNALLEATVGNIVGVFVLIAGSLALLRMDLTLGTAAFLAAGALFLENRKRILSGLPSAGPSQQALPSLPAASVAPPAPEPGPARVQSLATPAADLIDGELHPAHETPEQDSVSFAPSESTGSNTFQPVGESINTKAVLPSGTPSSTIAAAAKYQQEGLAGPAI